MGSAPTESGPVTSAQSTASGHGDRLAAQDLIAFWPELRGWPQDVGALALIDSERLLDAQGRLRMAEVRAAIAAGLGAAPRFRQVVVVPPRWKGRPLWLDHPGFVISDHVHEWVLPDPGGEAQLLAAVAHLGRAPLRRDRPLWQMWLCTGLHDGRVAMYVRVHHAVADGATALGMLTALLTPAATTGVTTPAAPAPTPRALPGDRRSRVRAVPADVRARPATRGGQGPQAGQGDRRGDWPLRQWVAGAPRCSINRTVGSDRALIVQRWDLARVLEAGHAHESTVNDVLVTGIAGGLRALLQARGEPVDVTLRAMVPVNLRAGRRDAAAGNMLGSMIAPVPVGIPDPVECLGAVARATASLKPAVRPRRMPVLRSRWAQQAAMALLQRQRSYNVYLANVPGPRGALELAGAPVREVFPIVALMGNLSLGVGALSYRGALEITVVTDPTVLPDAHVFADGMASTLHALTAAST